MADADRQRPSRRPGRTRLDTWKTGPPSGASTLTAPCSSRRPTGSAPVGSWQAGTPEEGLAHFARRYDDLVTEVNLVEARLGSGAADAAALARHDQAAARVAAPRRTSSATSTASSARLEKLTAVAAEKADEPGPPARPPGPRPWPRKTALVVEAEGLAAESTSWKASGDRFKAILDEWKADQRRRPQGRRRAVEAVRGRAGHVHPPPRCPLRHPRRQPQAGQSAQGRAGRGGRDAVRRRPSGTRPPTGSRS